jgi:hypothetical protein
MNLADVTNVAERLISDVSPLSRVGPGPGFGALHGAEAPAPAAPPTPVPAGRPAFPTTLPLTPQPPTPPTPQDLELLIGKAVDTDKADYAVITGVQIHNCEAPRLAGLPASLPAPVPPRAARRRATLSLVIPASAHPLHTHSLSHPQGPPTWAAPTLSSPRPPAATP